MILRSGQIGLANSVDPDQTTQKEQSGQGLHCCHSVCIFWVHVSTVKPHCLNVRVITAGPSCSKLTTSLVNVTLKKLKHIIHKNTAIF